MTIISGLLEQKSTSGSLGSIPVAIRLSSLVQAPITMRLPETGRITLSTVYASALEAAVATSGTSTGATVCRRSMKVVMVIGAVLLAS